MNLWKLILNSLRFYWRTNLGVVLGAAVGSAVLVGALVVGDSVTQSLKALALSRIGEVHLALHTPNRDFRAQLAEDLEADLAADTAPVLMLNGSANLPDGSARATNVQVIGTDERFWELADSPEIPQAASAEGLLINQRLSRQLDVGEGDVIILRVEKPSDLPRDAPLAKDTDASVAERLTVQGVVANEQFGRFGLQANQIPPYNAYVSLSWIQQQLGMPGQANMLLVSDKENGESPTVEEAETALDEHWTLGDGSLKLNDHSSEAGYYELGSDRVFIDPPLAESVFEAGNENIAILTYFVNELRVGDKATPYSMVSAVEAGQSIPPSNILPNDLQNDEIVISQWLADDLGAQAGDTLELKYFVLSSMRRLDERTRSFTVREILPMEGAAVDPELMPDFPGLSDADDCRDWDPGFPIDLDKIRDKDEDYWDEYRGTPKAYVTLEAGQEMWGNRFGNLTAIRYEASNISLAELKHDIRSRISPASIGMFFMPIRESALAASTQGMGTDFGMLFIGLSMFLIAAALLLMGLLFVFGIEQRAQQVGTLLALGFPTRRVQRILLLEGAALALLGGAIGTFFGLLYTRAILYALSTVWADAIGGRADIQFHAQPSTMLIGCVSAVLMAMVAIWLSVRRQAQAPARELLQGANPEFKMLLFGGSASRGGVWLSLICIIGAVLLLAFLSGGGSAQMAGAFFGAGALLLAAGISLSHVLLNWLANSAESRRLTGFSLGIRNGARKRGRSLAIVGLLACGSFLIIAIDAYRHDPAKHADERSSGTGGFALFGQTTLPVYRDLNSEDGRQAFGLSEEQTENVQVVPMRLREGDDASCLNLNRAQTPQLLGVQPELLKQRGAFTFVKTMEGFSREAGWSMLNEPLEDGTIPAIGDQPTIVWALGKSLGDTLTYVDERGETFKVKIVGMLTNTILQGSLVISEGALIERYPSDSGYEMFLIDAPFEQTESISESLSRALRERGLELTTTAERLALFSQVEHTYLSIFQVLGGLGLLLGSVGLGVVVLRNVLERRNELALLTAVGFKNAAVKKVVIVEHYALMLLGLLCGVVAALVAIFPSIVSPGSGISYTSIVLTVAGVCVSGAIWTWLAAHFALRGPILDALRSE